MDFDHSLLVADSGSAANENDSRIFDKKPRISTAEVRAALARRVGKVSNRQENIRVNKQGGWRGAGGIAQ
jgi:hypothetical protein